MPGSEPILQHILSHPHQVPCRLFFYPGYPYLRQFPCPVQLGQLHRVTPVRLHPVTGSYWRMPGRDHHALESLARQMSLQLISARPCFIHKRQGFPATQPIRHPFHGFGCILNLEIFLHFVRTTQQKRTNYRILVYIQSDHRAKIYHEPAPPYADRLPQGATRVFGALLATPFILRRSLAHSCYLEPMGFSPFFFICLRRPTVWRLEQRRELH